jgi:hypothetical protein
MVERKGEKIRVVCKKKRVEKREGEVKKNTYLL